MERASLVAASEPHSTRTLARGEAWQRTGCDERCRLVRAIQPGRLGWTMIESHDPEAHEAHAAWRSGQFTPSAAEGPVVRTGPLVIDLDRIEVTVDGQPCGLSPIELRIMVALAGRAGAVVFYPDLIAQAWGPSYLVGPWQDVVHIVRVHLARLRGRLGRAGTLITTLPTFGLRLEMVALDAGLGPPRTRSSAGRPLGPRQWSLLHPRCVCCGTTDQRHKGHGRCQPCSSNLTRRLLHYGPCAAPPERNGHA